MGSTTANILIVDDVEVNRTVLCEYCKFFGFNTIQATDTDDIIKMITDNNIDLVLLDVKMPTKSGIQILTEIKTDNLVKDIPVIMTTGSDELDVMVKCVELGADDYLVKPLKLALTQARINTSLEKKWLHDQIKHVNQQLESRVNIQATQIKTTEQSIIFAMARLVEFRDSDTGGHITRMAEYSKALAINLSKKPKYREILTLDYICYLYRTSPLHDIGKIAIPDNVLMKPSKLTAEEFEIMKTHPTIGERVLTEIQQQNPDNGMITVAIAVAGAHHEKWDGSGYPKGLKGDDIPLAGRILALADVYDALVSKRAYKEAFTTEEARSIIIEGKGKHFDPDIVDSFLECESEFNTIITQHKEDMIP